jgi:hypothetical protein
MSLFSDVFSISVEFESVQSSLLLKFCQVCLIVKETAEIETGMAAKSRWDQANIRQKLGLVWRNRRKLAKLSKTTFTSRSSS